MKKSHIAGILAALLIIILTGFFFTNRFNPPYVQTQASQAALTPEQALEKLQAGNRRFVSAKIRERDHIAAAKITSEKGQFPFAIILNCIDSRSRPEIVLDQGIGNIFTASVAGNLISPDILGSIEYAINHAGAKLIVIMGHTQCGAVTAACGNGEYAPLLQQLLDQIKPAVSLIKNEHPSLSCDNNNDINAIAKQNVINQMKAALRYSQSIQKRVDDHSVLLVGAMHNLHLGSVKFFDINGNNL